MPINRPLFHEQAMSSQPDDAVGRHLFNLGVSIVQFRQNSTGVLADARRDGIRIARVEPRQARDVWNGPPAERRAVAQRVSQHGQVSPRCARLRRAPTN